MDKPTPASELPDWQAHSDAWRMRRNYSGVDSGVESAMDLIFKTVPTLFDKKASGEEKAEARRQIERATIRVAVYTTISSRTGEVYDLKWKKENALIKEGFEKRVDEAVDVFLAEHEASGNEKFYASHIWDVGETRYRVTNHKILDRVLPKPIPNTEQAGKVYNAILKASIVWDDHNNPDPQSPAFNKPAIQPKILPNARLPGKLFA